MQKVSCRACGKNLRTVKYRRVGVCPDCLIQSSPKWPTTPSDYLRKVRKMMRNISAVVCGLLLLSAVKANAQTACPGGPSSATISSQATPKVIFCAPTTDSIVGAYVYGLPTTKIPVNGIGALSGPYGDGLTQYQGTIPPQPRGTYSVTVTSTNYGIPGDATTIQEGGASSPFSLTVADPAPRPSAPSKFYISK